MNLHRQVALMFAGVALAVTAVLGVSTALLLYPVMVEQRERTTERQAAIHARIIEQVVLAAPDQLADTLRGLDRPIASYSLVYVDGRWYTSNVTADPLDLPAGVRASAVAGRQLVVRVSLPTGPSLVNVRPLPAAGAGYVEVFGLSDITQTTRTLILVLVAAGTVTTGLGIALGRWAATAALRPVTALTRAAAAVASGDLDTRVSPGRAADLRMIADAFNRTVAALRRRVERDARFAANVSHELRTPLMTIVNAVEILDARRATLTPADREVVGLLRAEVRRFQRTVTDLLEISTAPDRAFVFEPLSLAEVVQVADTVAGRPVVGTTGTGDGAIVTGDRTRLERVVVNLVDNAQRHGGGVVAVTVEPGRDTVRIVVDDAGPGVPANLREQIFERFGRASGGSAGTGLGLALVAEEVRRHAGRVWVEDRPKGGARFVVELPTDPGAAHALPQA
ncbi:Signal transduction histidine kinase [Asanoa hainanensis]|uniref:histidine kinase n=2 Tax=Asanoa hainanensis TaxID=560556 RepID=A0A239PF89_9ACTN|nr:Signal transduction histidine kinase [Asanoa hainanensis]